MIDIGPRQAGPRTEEVTPVGSDDARIDSIEAMQDQIDVRLTAMRAEIAELRALVNRRQQRAARGAA